MKTRIASIDFGLKRLGVAISDENKIVATSVGVLLAGKNHEETIKSLLLLLKSYTLEKIIIGNPLHLDGRSSPLSLAVAEFQQQLQKHVSCEVALFDERLSTMQAERALKSGNVNRKKRSQVIDALSAVIILQSFLGY